MEVIAVLPSEIIASNPSRVCKWIGFGLSGRPMKLILKPISTASSSKEFFNFSGKWLETTPKCITSFKIAVGLTGPISSAQFRIGSIR